MAWSSPRWLGGAQGDVPGLVRLGLVGLGHVGLGFGRL